MFDSFRTPLLRWLQVPPEPDAPAGSPDSVRVFRAGRNFYLLSLLRWALAQVVVAGGAFMLLFLNTALVRKIHTPWLRAVWISIEGLGVATFLTQLFLTYAILRLNYELRWYIVTDRSLRIRSGIWSVEELTMTFANIQQVNLKQGPLQRLLGLADVEVTSAGGGEGSTAHKGRFAGVGNAPEIRDLMLDRLRAYRDSGLGDPDEHHAPAPGIQEAAQETLAEARKLRNALSGGSAAT